MTRLVADSGAAYRLHGEPVVGGEALVYRGTAEEDGGAVAVKVALAPGGELPAQVARMARLASHPIAGPAVLPVWDAGRWGDRPFAVLAWHDQTLADWVRGRSPGDRLAACRALVASVRALHAAGEAHGDLKPGNALVVGEEPTVLLTDLGVGGLTPGYAAPERGGLAADRFAVGAACFELLCGHRPDGAHEALERALAGRLPRFGSALTAEDRRALAVAPSAVGREIAALLRERPWLRPDLDRLDRALAGRRRAVRWPLAALALLPVAAAVDPAGPCPRGLLPDGATCVHADGTRLAFVPGGAFTMGRAPGDDVARYPDAPPHPVTLTSGLWLATTEVTQAEWAAIAGENPVAVRGQWLDDRVRAPCAAWHDHSLVGDALPVVCVSFVDVVRWLNERSRRDGLAPAYALGETITWDRGADGWRLPTEAEWERAAKLGATGAPVCERANLRDLGAPELWGNEAPCDDGDPVLAPVARRAPDALGLFDLEGNALEWVWDRYGPYPASALDPTGPLLGPARVQRGASWNHVPRGPAARYAADPTTYAYATGFRAARSAR